MTDVQNFESFWKYSNFGRNSYILKVLAHKKSGEILKIQDILNFHGIMNGRIN